MNKFEVFKENLAIKLDYSNKLLFLVELVTKSLTLQSLNLKKKLAQLILFSLFYSVMFTPV